MNPNNNVMLVAVILLVVGLAVGGAVGFYFGKDAGFTIGKDSGYAEGKSAGIFESELKTKQEAYLFLLFLRRTDVT